MCADKCIAASLQMNQLDLVIQVHCFLFFLSVMICTFSVSRPPQCRNVLKIIMGSTERNYFAEYYYLHHNTKMVVVL